MGDRDFTTIFLNEAGDLSYSKLADYFAHKIEGSELMLIAESFSGPLAILLAKRLANRVKAF